MGNQRKVPTQAMEDHDHPSWTLRTRRSASTRSTSDMIPLRGASLSRYPEGLANLIVASLAPDLSLERVPAMPCITRIDHGHRVRFPDDLSTMPSVMAGITKLLSRNEMFQGPQALKAITEEGCTAHGNLEG